MLCRCHFSLGQCLRHKETLSWVCKLSCIGAARGVAWVCHGMCDRCYILCRKGADESPFRSVFSTVHLTHLDTSYSAHLYPLHFTLQIPHTLHALTPLHTSHSKLHPLHSPLHSLPWRVDNGGQYTKLFSCVVVLIPECLT